MSFLSNSQYFPRSGTLLSPKQNGVLSYICREFSEVTSHRTLTNCKTQSKGWYSCSTMSNSVSKSFCSHKQTFLCKLDENNKMELEEYLFPVSCVTSQQGARPWVCFRKIIVNEWFWQLWTLISRKVRRFFHWNSGIVPHLLHTITWRKVVLVLHFNFKYINLPSDTPAFLPNPRPVSRNDKKQSSDALKHYGIPVITGVFWTTSIAPSISVQAADKAFLPVRPRVWGAFPGSAELQKTHKRSGQGGRGGW